MTFQDEPLGGAGRGTCRRVSGEQRQVSPVDRGPKSMGIGVVLLNQAAISGGIKVVSCLFGGRNGIIGEQGDTPGRTASATSWVQTGLLLTRTCFLRCPTKPTAGVSFIGTPW